MPDDNFQMIYAQVCTAHDGIAEFRAKLLALLPIASGGGIFLLLDKVDTTFLAPIGVFGMIVSVGLFVYELRGIQRCNALISLGSKLEGNTGGRFTRDQNINALGGVVGATGAAVTIYSAVIAAWSYVAIRGIAQLQSKGVLISAVVLLLAAASGTIVILLQQRKERILDGDKACKNSSAGQTTTSSTSASGQ